VTIEYRRRSTTGTGVTPVLIECPACGEPIADTDKTSAHIGDHTPEDFGLTPIVATDGGQR
jgi:hypothetical protein